jgi:NAD(P)-dependent dehydrogenase (short-subunit alcohol dehydrogenase family)
MKLSNKVALITGGTGGIGKETAILFLKEGARVFITDIDPEELGNAVEELSKLGTVDGKSGDISKSGDVKAVVKACIVSFGTLDVVFANAGIEGVVKPLTEYPEEVYDKVLSVNVKGVWNTLRFTFPHLEKNGGGSVIITSSVAGLRGTPNVMAYVTSKHAVTGSMKVAALEGAPKGIRVNSIHPSPVDNRMMRSLEEGFAPGEGEVAKEQFEQTIPLGRYANNDEIAKLALFLASDDSSFITGAQYPIDGGMTT